MEPDDFLWYYLEFFALPTNATATPLSLVDPPEYTILAGPTCLPVAIYLVSANPRTSSLISASNWQLHYRKLPAIAWSLHFKCLFRDPDCLLSNYALDIFGLSYHLEQLHLDGRQSFFAGPHPVMLSRWPCCTSRDLDIHCEKNCFTLYVSSCASVNIVVCHILLGPFTSLRCCHVHGIKFQCMILKKRKLAWLEKKLLKNAISIKFVSHQHYFSKYAYRKGWRN